MKINKITACNFQAKNQIRTSKQTINKFDNVNKEVFAPAYAYKQFSVNFSGKKDEPKDGENQIIEIGFEELETLLAEQLNLSELSGEEKDEIKKNFVGTLFSALAQEAVNVGKVPAGLSQKEEDIFMGLSQLANIQSTFSRPRRDVFVFSNAFATQTIEYTLSEIPNNAPLYSKQEFSEVLQKLNRVENSKVGDVIKASFTKTNKETNKELIRSFDALFIDADVKKLGNGRTLEEYSLSIGEKVYVEKNQDGNFERVLRTYKNEQSQKETPNIVYEFDEKGALSKITKFDNCSNILVELLIDNKKRTVTVLENDEESRLIRFENGKFIEN